MEQISQLFFWLQWRPWSKLSWKIVVFAGASYAFSSKNLFLQRNYIYIYVNYTKDSIVFVVIFLILL